MTRAARVPGWYYPAVGLLLAQFVLVHGTTSGVGAAFASSIALVAGAGALPELARRTGGRGPERATGRRSRGVLVGVVIATLAVLLPPAFDLLGGSATVWVAVAGFAVAVGGGLAYEAAQRADAAADDTAARGDRSSPWPPPL